MERQLILIAGGTASGKTMVAEQIAAQYKASGKEYTLITIDNYYKNLDQIGVANHSDVNWDDPNVFDWEKLRSDVDSLLEGNDVTGYTYNYGTGFYSDEGFEIKASEHIIVEGIYGLYDKALRDRANIKIFVDVDSDIRMMRRIKRDSEGRYANNFDSDEFMKQWEDKIKPMHNQFIQPTMEHADIILKNNKELNDQEKTSLITLLQSIVVK